jgi:PAS domain S-box-containing protein
MYGIVQDITERKRAEEALRQSEELLNSTQRLAKVGGWEWDMQNQTIFWTEETYRIHGFNPNEIEPDSTEYIERSLECYDPDDRPVILEAFERCTQQGEAYDLEFPFTTVQGHRKWIRTTAQAEREKGEIVKVIGNIADITERKRAEEALQEYSERLEEMVAERTRELEQAQAELLRQERLSALGRLTATVAHEIRNPLGTVRTAVFAIGDAIERDELHRLERARQLAERNIIRCDRIISELLDYTRERALQLKPTNIDEWLDAVLDEQNIPESIVCIRKLSAGAEVPIDREHLRRAVINVVSNAVDALQGEGAVGNQLTVSSHVVGSRLEIRVSDTGPGIPADVMEKIFEPLFSTKRFGVGLGLPIVKNILQQHGGDIEIKRRVGEGTTVTLWLPIPNSNIS